MAIGLQCCKGQGLNEAGAVIAAEGRRCEGVAGVTPRPGGERADDQHTQSCADRIEGPCFCYERIQVTACAVAWNR